MSDYWLKSKLLQLLDLPIAVIKRFGADRLPRHAASLAFSSLLALAPMTALGLSLFGVFSGFETLSVQLENFIYQYLVPTASDDVRLYMSHFVEKVGKLTVWGLVFFFLTALLMLSNIESSFNDIWRVKSGRTLGNRLAVYWAMISLAPLLMGISLTVSTYLLSLSIVDKDVQHYGITFLPILLEMLAFLLLYLVMPNVRVSLMHGLVGALVATLLFEMTKRGFAFYIANFANYEIVYGALATLPIFLIWIYLCWVVTLIGAEVVAELQNRKLLEDTLLDRITQ